jgi:hypothetical protein
VGVIGNRSWAEAHHERTGEWRKIHSGLIPEALGETWRRVDNALKLGLRGLPGGFSLVQLRRYANAGSASPKVFYFGIRESPAPIDREKK